MLYFIPIIAAKAPLSIKINWLDPSSGSVSNINIFAYKLNDSNVTKNKRGKIATDKGKFFFWDSFNFFFYKFKQKYLSMLYEYTYLTKSLFNFARWKRI